MLTNQQQNIQLPKKLQNSPLNLTQVVISSDQNRFIIARKSNDSITDIICPFTKSENKDEFDANFILPINQLYRIQALFDIIPTVAKYTVINNMVKFNCLYNVPLGQQIDSNISDGFIHFVLTQKKLDNQSKELETYFEPKLILSSIKNSISLPINYNQKIKFKSEFLKAFPIILRNGFIFSLFEKNRCQIFMTLIKPSERLIGDCSRFEICNTIQYILPLWPIFDINISKAIKIKLREDFIDDLFKNEKDPILIHASYNLDKTNEIKISKIGNNVAILPD